MGRFVDLHCHFVPSIDDGARTVEQSEQIVRKLAELGFGTVYATPHMRPGLFDNDAPALERSFAEVAPRLRLLPDCPDLALGCEHYFDDVVFERILAGKALPFPGGHAILVELPDAEFPLSLEQRLADLTRRGMRPVLAHPERYQPVAKNPERLEQLLDVGAVALLDLGALVGKYGRHATKTAEALLDRGLYAAACTDAHRPGDVVTAGQAMDRLVKLCGEDALTALLVDGPRQLLAGSRLGGSTTAG